jgi:hypothetical protein
MAFLSPERFGAKARRRRDAFVNVFTTPDGEYVLNELLDYCGWGKDLFNENPIVMANLVGRRNPVLHIKAILNQSDQQIDALIERFKEQERRFPDG